MARRSRKEFERNAKWPNAQPDRFDLIDLLDLQDRLRAALDGAPVDIATRASLHRALRRDIEASAIRVF